MVTSVTDISDTKETTMKVFVTGATGFIGSAIVRELLEAGHEVTGLARSESSAEALERAGAQTHRGTLEDVDSLRAGAAAADGVIHTAFIHDFTRHDESAEIDRRAVAAFIDTLAGSDRPLVIASGTALIPGKVITEADRAGAEAPSPRAQTELVMLDGAGRRVRTAIIRLPPTVHGEGDHGFVPVLIAKARERGEASFVGDGAGRWAAVHRLDAARLFAWAVEHATPGSVLHSVGEEGVPTRDIADAIGRGLGIPTASIGPDEAAEQLGFIGVFFGRDVPASSALTQERTGWRPEHPGLLEDLAEGGYFAETQLAP
jgi:nucleoside-diphosphate-sugar epimerase